MHLLKLFRRKEPPVTLAKFYELQAKVLLELEKRDALEKQWMDNNKPDGDEKRVQVCTAGPWSIMRDYTPEQEAAMYQWVAERMKT